MGLSDILSGDLAAIMRDFPQTVTIGGTDYACAAGDGQGAREQAMAGFRPSGEITLALTVADFQTLPHLGDRATHDGKAWRIVEVNLFDNDPAFTIRMERQV